MIVVTDRILDLGLVVERFGVREGTGSVAIHLAVVKPRAGDRPTAGIRFTRDGDPEGELRALEQRLRDRFDVEDVLLARRVGELRVGEVISLVAIAAAGRDDAFGACRAAVNGFKEMKGLGKQELYEG